MSNTTKTKKAEAKRPAKLFFQVELEKSDKKTEQHVIQAVDGTKAIQLGMKKNVEDEILGAYIVNSYETLDELLSDFKK